MLTLFPLFSVVTMMFWAFVFMRVLMAFLSWGYFVPDETWQSVEVAHKLGTVHVFTVKSTGQICRYFIWSQIFPVQIYWQFFWLQIFLLQIK